MAQPLHSSSSSSWDKNNSSSRYDARRDNDLNHVCLAAIVAYRVVHLHCGSRIRGFTRFALLLLGVKRAGIWSL